MDASDALDVQGAPRGLGGWLVLVGLGVVFAPFRILLTVYQDYYVPIASGTFRDFLDPSSEVYRAGVLEFLIFEGAANAAMLLLTLLLVFGFFRTKTWFPRIYIFVILASVVVLFADSLGAMWLFPEVDSSEVFDKVTVREIGRSVVSACIWIPYMLVSKRVKNTFVA